jgi:signal transduction histidine kinase
LEAKDLSRQAQAEMDALLNELRPAGLDERGLIAALTDYLDTFERREGIEVQFDNQTSSDLEFPLSYEQALFRVAQEAMANVSRHASASYVDIELRATREIVTLKISDDGMGFDPALLQNGTTMGLRGMRERLIGLGGTLTVDTAPGKGTLLDAQLPRPEEEGSHV